VLPYYFHSFVGAAQRRGVSSKMERQHLAGSTPAGSQRSVSFMVVRRGACRLLQNVEHEHFNDALFV